MSKDEPLAEERPFDVEELDAERAIARFAEYVDHRRTAALDLKLFEAMRQHKKLACDVSASVEIDSDWLTLMAAVTIEAEQAGKRVGVVGLNAALEKSADILGLDALQLFSDLAEVWK
jgi:anti-anti-sigma regulatory factor